MGEARFFKQIVVLREIEVEFWGRNLENSLYFSLLAGEFGGEELARDCNLYQISFSAINRLLHPVIQSPKNV